MPPQKAEKKAYNGSGFRGKEKHKVTRRGSTRTPRDRMDLVIMKQGMYQTFKPVSCSPYAGTAATFGSYNMEQAIENRRLGLLD